MKRRSFVQNLSALAISVPALGLKAAAEMSHGESTGFTPVTGDREYWIKTLTHIADPVLNNLSRRELKKNMPVEALPGRKEERAQFSYLEALGRLFAGMAPWL